MLETGGQALVREAVALRDWVSTEVDEGDLRLGTVHTVLYDPVPDFLEAFSL